MLTVQRVFFTLFTKQMLISCNCFCGYTVSASCVDFKGCFLWSFVCLKLYKIDWLHSQVYTVYIFGDIFAWKKRLRELKWLKISQAFHTSYFNFAKCMHHPKSESFLWNIFEEHGKRHLVIFRRFCNTFSYIPKHYVIHQCIIALRARLAAFSTYSFESKLDKLLFI